MTFYRKNFVHLRVWNDRKEEENKAKCGKEKNRNRSNIILEEKLRIWESQNLQHRILDHKPMEVQTYMHALYGMQDWHQNTGQ